MKRQNKVAQNKFIVGIIGHVAAGKEFFDGQTVSTRLWVEEFQKSPQCSGVKIVDTFHYKRRLLQILFSFFSCLCSCNAIVIILSRNGQKFFLPLLYYCNKIFKRKIFQRAIGGNLDDFIIKNPKYIKYLNALEVNWVQSERLVKKIAALGVTNGRYLENFRRITPIDLEKEPINVETPYKFCTFCRVTKSKGISDAIISIAKVNQDCGRVVATLDVYGPLESDYKDEFSSLVDQHRDCVQYMGSIDSKNAVHTLKNYYMHLFPTHWCGEGFPGTLIDCYNAALPTIASDWAYNTEFIIPEKTGYIYHWENPEELTIQIKKSLDLPLYRYWEMRENNLLEAKKYTADYVMGKVLNEMTYSLKTR